MFSVFNETRGFLWKKLIFYLKVFPFCLEKGSELGYEKTENISLHNSEAQRPGLLRFKGFIEDVPTSLL